MWKNRKKVEAELKLKARAAQSYAETLRKALSEQRQRADYQEKLRLNLQSDIAAAVGMNGNFTTELLLRRLTELRSSQDTMHQVWKVMTGIYDADQALLRRLACALGTSELDEAAVIRRASQMNLNTNRIAALERELESVQDEDDY